MSSQQSGEFSHLAIDAKQLEPEKVPGRASSWPDIFSFALSYDGYANWSRGDVATFANEAAAHWRSTRELPGSLEELRACLFFEQRRWHHFGDTPSGQSAEYFFALLEAIRARLT